MNAATRNMISEWFNSYHGDAEKTARYMTRIPGLGMGIKTARAMVRTATRRTFEMNGNAYETDAFTLKVLRSAIESYREAGSVDASAVAAVMGMGLEAGKISELS